MEKLSGRDRLLLFLLLALGAGFCFVRFVLVPQVRAYAATREELAAATGELSRCRELAGSLRAERQHLERLREEVAATAASFRTEVRDGAGIVLLAQAAAEKNVRVTAVEPGAVRENKYTLALPLRITAEGNYAGVLAFCRELEQEGLGNLAEIRSLKVEGINEPGAVRAMLDLVVFSDRSPQGRLVLETLAGWPAGRVNVFEPVGSAMPAPGSALRAADAAPSGGAALPSAARVGTGEVVLK
ncbi:MAG: hypothetical protein HPY90_13225 [Syntrophothermus sp.]|uniref:hypothetical protein n=1 Tax=Syntrophothermus sp. TaxID=2736299 RepID=UPI00257DF3C1|nr:hypothetical protein [Syntrophothermus sp.]NSW84210.1 hypothetical protein [Syntrophothermus sp.]